MFESWTEALTDSFINVWDGFVDILPALIAAFLVLVIGWAIAALLGRLVAKLIHMLWIEKALDKLNVKKGLETAGFKFDFADLVGWLVKWFLIIVVFITAADILDLKQITLFLQSVVLYIPNIVIAVVILILGIVLGNFVKNAIEQGVKATKLVHHHFVAGVAKWSIVVFSFMAALVQLKVAAVLIQTLFVGFVIMVALAGGLAFGLGGKEWAEKLLDKMRKDISKD